MGDVAAVGAVFPLLPSIVHESLATAGAGVLYFIFALKQITMDIPPSSAAMVRAEASPPMSSI